MKGGTEEKEGEEEEGEEEEGEEKEKNRGHKACAALSYSLQLCNENLYKKTITLYGCDS